MSVALLEQDESGSPREEELLLEALSSAAASATRVPGWRLWQAASFSLGLLEERLHYTAQSML